ncbi:hypothetical protein CsatB_013598 [Cannabis sativa]
MSSAFNRFQRCVFADIPHLLECKNFFFRIFWLVIAFSAPLLYYQIHKGPPLSHVEAHLSSSSCPYSIPYEVEKQHHQ